LTSISGTCIYDLCPIFGSVLPRREQEGMAESARLPVGIRNIVLLSLLLCAESIAGGLLLAPADARFDPEIIRWMKVIFGGLYLVLGLGLLSLRPIAYLLYFTLVFADLALSVFVLCVYPPLGFWWALPIILSLLACKLGVLIFLGDPPGYETYARR